MGNKNNQDPEEKKTNQEPAKNNVDADTAKYLKTVKEVAQFINDKGWPISRATVYRHFDRALIPVAENGFFHIDAVTEYAKGYLDSKGKLPGGGRKKKERSHILEDQQKEQIRKLKAGAEYQEVKTAILRGDWQPVED